MSPLVSPVLVYIAGPYRDPRGAYYVRQNIRDAERVALSCWSYGIPALCPHLNTALFDGAEPDEVWLQGDLVMLRRCDAVVVVPGWERSSGTCAEVAHARERGIPVLEWGTAECDRWITRQVLARGKDAP